MVAAVFFDLDGTLIDTARDMARILNKLLAEEGQAPLDYDLIRSEVSHGAKAMILLGFDEPEGTQRFEQLRLRYLDLYKEEIHVETELFPHMDQVLNTLEQHDIPWGVITNKPSWLTLPLMESMNLKARAATIICADTAGVSKPDPKPMFDACEETGVEAQQCMYVGDDLRDVEAAHNAGMPCIAMRCGYIRRGHNPDDWGAEHIMDTTAELLTWAKQQTNTAAA